MSEYLIGGHYNCERKTTEEKKRFQCEKEIREFIWKNWTEKRRSYIKVSGRGIDLSYTDHIFIEPNSNNEWEVNLRLVTEHIFPEHTGVRQYKGKFELSDKMFENGEKRILLIDKNGVIFSQF